MTSEGRGLCIFFEKFIYEEEEQQQSKEHSGLSERRTLEIENNIRTEQSAQQELDHERVPLFVLCDERVKAYLRGTFDNIHKNYKTTECEEIEEKDNIIGQPVNAGKCQTVPHKP